MFFIANKNHALIEILGQINKLKYCNDKFFDDLGYTDLTDYFKNFK